MRQIERYYEIVQRRRRHAKADMVEACAAAFGGKAKAYARDLRKG